MRIEDKIEHVSTDQLASARDPVVMDMRGPSFSEIGISRKEHEPRGYVIQRIDGHRLLRVKEVTRKSPASIEKYFGTTVMLLGSPGNAPRAIL